jgi:hypothetical protein
MKAPLGLEMRLLSNVIVGQSDFHPGFRHSLKDLDRLLGCFARPSRSVLFQQHCEEKHYEKLILRSPLMIVLLCLLRGA